MLLLRYLKVELYLIEIYYTFKIEFKAHPLALAESEGCVKTGK